MENKDMPAFPESVAVGMSDDFVQSGFSGLTKRELFALGAMVGMLANPQQTAELYITADKFKELGADFDMNKCVSKEATDLADALLEALEDE